MTLARADEGGNKKRLPIMMRWREISDWAFKGHRCWPSCRARVLLSRDQLCWVDRSRPQKVSIDSGSRPALSGRSYDWVRGHCVVARPSFSNTAPANCSKRWVEPFFVRRPSVNKGGSS